MYNYKFNHFDEVSVVCIVSNNNYNFDRLIFIIFLREFRVGVHKGSHVNSSKTD